MLAVLADRTGAPGNQDFALGGRRDQRFDAIGLARRAGDLGAQFAILDAEVADQIDIGARLADEKKIKAIIIDTKIAEIMPNARPVLM